MAEERKFIARMQILGADQVKRESEGAARSVEASAQRMQTAWQRVGGQAEGLEGGFKKLNRGVNDARGAIELLGGAIPGLDGAFGTMTRTIGNVADVFGTLSALFLRNPIGLLATGVAAAAAAFVYFNRTADEATAAVNASGSGAKSAAVDWAKLVDPIKTVGALLDQIKGKQIEALGGPRNAVTLQLAAQRQEVERLKREIESVRPVEPSAQNRLGQERLPQEMATLRLRAQKDAAAESANNRARLADLNKVLGEAEAKVRELEGEEEKLRILQKAGENEFAGLGKGPTQKLIDEGLAAQEKLRAAGAAAAAEEQRAIDQLIARFAPATKAQQELTAARADAIRLMRDGKITTAEFEEVLRGIADAEEKGTEAAQQRAQVQQFAARTIEEVKSAEERYAEALGATDAALRAGLITADQAARKRELEVKRLNAATSDASDEAKRNKDIARDLGLTFQSAFEDAIVRGKKFGDVLKGIGEDIARLIVRFTITIPLARALSETVERIFSGGSGGKSSGLGGLLGGIGDGLGSALSNLFGGGGGQVVIGANTGIYARGGVFDRGAEVIPFARGGAIVDRPTMFDMRGGRLGLMGEAGPEAIMPLERGPDGSLGVRGGGGGGMVVNFAPVIDARGADKELRDRLPGLLRESEQRMIAEVRRLADRGGSFSRSVGRRVV